MTFTEPDKSNKTSKKKFREYLITDSIPLIKSQRPYAFIFSGQNKDLDLILNYKLKEISPTTYLGIREDVLNFGFSFERFIELITTGKLNKLSIEKNMKYIIKNEKLKNDSFLSRKDELDILAEFF